ncbi:unknown [Prevotella sp. CAG:255]|nr:unknown [Prevotella sp. CAG:255]
MGHLITLNLQMIHEDIALQNQPIKIYQQAKFTHHFTILL